MALRVPKNPRSRRDLALIEKKIDVLHDRLTLRRIALELLPELQAAYPVLLRCERLTAWPAQEWNAWSLHAETAETPVSVLYIGGRPTLAQAVIAAVAQAGLWMARDGTVAP